MNRRELGEYGEGYACEMLKRLGYSITARNHHERCGEIDIIAENEEFILFIEVKTRSIGSMVSGEQAVDAAKQRKLVKTARKYLFEHSINKQPRFDVISITVSTGARPEIISAEHYENAFGAEADE